MTDSDALLARELASAFPAPVAPPDWRAVRRAARRPRATAAAFVVATLAAIFGVLPALGVGRDVLWLRSKDHPEYGYTYASADTKDGRFELRASRGQWLGISAWLNGRLVASGGGPDESLHGIGKNGPRYVGLSAGWAGRHTEWITGAVAKEVERVDLTLEGGTTRRASIVQPPKTVHTDLRFYYAVFSRRPTVVAVTALGHGNRVLERHHVILEIPPGIPAPRP